MRRCPGRPDPDRPPAIGRDGRYSIDGRTVAVIDNQRLSTPLGAPLALRDDGGYHLETGESRRPMTVGLALESADGRVLRRSLMTLEPQSFQSITYRQAPARLIKMVAGQAQLGSVSGEPP